MAYSKSFLSVMTFMIRAILYPGAKLFSTAGGKEQAAQILQEKVTDICTKIPAFAKEIDWSRGATREGKDSCRYVFKSGSTLQNLAARESSRGLRFTAGIMEECVGIDQKILQEIIIPRRWGLNNVNCYEKPCEPKIRVFAIFGELTGNERIPCQAW